MTASVPAKRLGKAFRAITGNGDPGQVISFARQWGIDGRLGRRAAKDIEINASAYLRLCGAVGIDPATGRPAPAEEFTDIDWRLVSLTVCMTLIEKSLSIRAAAKRWKLSPAAVVRLREGEPVNVENFLAFCKATGAKPTKFRTRVPVFHGKQSVEQVEHV
ncbi:MAG: hypothetical protein WDN48_05870 [Pseudolabrys sp.]